LGRSERETHAGAYVRGLLLDGERKSIAPLAERVPGADVQALRQFVNWGWAPLQAALTSLMLDRLLPEAVLIIDETGFAKKCDHSVGVARGGGPPGPLSLTPTPRRRAGTFGVRVCPIRAPDRSPLRPGAHGQRRLDGHRSAAARKV